ncbi:hypothetical protein DERF_014986 [Dermatophagoides farinae]|uniref:Uncharacterized protein n=1 Tax=Dermatophagoides farinae TaxID=6954 RepID=A0A922KVG6_DERFA|nr:hypothetical protein DERF_014986 [Dermatophagoides farinae]
MEKKHINHSSIYIMDNGNNDPDFFCFYVILHNHEKFLLDLQIIIIIIIGMKSCFRSKSDQVKCHLEIITND